MKEELEGEGERERKREKERERKEEKGKKGGGKRKREKKTHQIIILVLNCLGNCGTPIKRTKTKGGNPMGKGEEEVRSKKRKKKRKGKGKQKEIKERNKTDYFIKKKGPFSQPKCCRAKDMRQALQATNILLKTFKIQNWNKFWRKSKKGEEEEMRKEA